MPETIDDPATLRAHYGGVSRPAALKQLSRLDSHCRLFIARTPFLVMATADPSSQ